MKKIIVLSLVLSVGLFSNAQSYQTAIGLRGGHVGGGHVGGVGLNLKHFISGKNALEVTLGGGANHLRGQLLYEWQNPTNIEEGLDWYIGVGGGFGTWSSSWDHPNGTDYNRGFFMGASGVIGLDWNLEPVIEVPLNIAFDLGPYIGLINSNRVGWGSGFALRYILK